MSFTVEDGTGTNPLANSYTSLAEFKAYFDDRGFAYSPTYSDAQIQQALVQATDYIDLMFEPRFKGYRLVQTPTEQPLAFPRTNLWVRCIYVSGIPADLKNAASEYAKIVLTTGASLSPTPAAQDSTGQILQASVQKVGPIEIHATYESGSGATRRDYPIPDRMLEQYMYSTGYQVVRN